MTGAPKPLDTVACPTCNDDTLQRELANLTGIAVDARAYRFKRVRQQQKNAAKGIAATLEVGGFVTLWGAPGCGKTYLLIAAVNKAISDYTEAYYTSTARMLDDLRNAFDAEEGEYARRWRRYVRMPVLALDECDKFNPTPWAVERFADLVNARFEAQRLVTLFATNADPRTFEPYLWSRMSAKRSRIFEVAGDDLRREIS